MGNNSFGVCFKWPFEEMRVKVFSHASDDWSEWSPD